LFSDFLKLLRDRGLPISVTEWMTLMEALEAGFAGSSIDRFYNLARAILVKDEANYDTFEQAFGEYFHNLSPPPHVTENVLEWLQDPVFPRELTEEEKAQLSRLTADELERELAERLEEQKGRHDRGNRFIGTGGTSPFGNGGFHPTGVRIGGSGGQRRGWGIQGRYRNLRHDQVLDTRQIELALRKLRRFTREGQREELDLEATITKAGKNAGDIELIFRRPRRNSVKLLLLMDVGGSMDPHTRVVERLFSAAYSARHFKSFRHYYFHNCVYEHLYENMELWEGSPTTRALAELDSSWLCIIVGDAAMHPGELSGRALSFEQGAGGTTGLDWLRYVRSHLPRSVWINPDPVDAWWSATVRVIAGLFPMYPMTLDGLDAALTDLLGSRPDAAKRLFGTHDHRFR
jgi:uncharacterized protein with von Willebrand factor type A (vWA) domain